MFLVRGVVGTHKFQYDIWGDAVNTGSRMESHGVLCDEFECEARGPIPVKGKGEMETYFVVGPKYGIKEKSVPA